MLRKFLIFGSTSFVCACGNTNFNNFLTTKAQEGAYDQQMIRAQFEFDQGNEDKALELTSDILRTNPFEEKALVLRAYSFLGKAGLDAFGLSQNLISQSQNSSTETNSNTTSASTDKTAQSLSSLSGVIGIDDAEISLLGTRDETTGTTIYLPKSRTNARAESEGIIKNIDAAVRALCPILQAGTDKDKAKDPRHDCEDSPFELSGQTQSHFAWALAHLGEAIAFYSVVLYTDGTSAEPNIQKVSTSLDPTNVSQFLSKLTALTKAISEIFPTDPTKAEDSMLNAMFNDLKITSLAFAAMGGVPASVTKSIDDAITNLEAKIAKVTPTTDTSATSDQSKQNAAVRNAFTTGLASQLSSKLPSLPADQKVEACTLYQQINSDPTKKPAGC